MVDYLIHHAKIIDGSGKRWFASDVAVEHGKITAIGYLQDMDALHHIHADGRYLTPGFIDIHRHGDLALFRPGYGKAELRQGLTTVINGNCGLSIAPVAGPYSADVKAYLSPITGPMADGQAFPTLESYFAQARQIPNLINNGMLVGMGTLRACAAGFEPGDLEAEELRKLHQLLEQALADGACGVSIGLGYAPECFYTTRGLIRALEPLRGSRIPVAVHMRQEGDGVEEALDEMLEVAGTLKLRLEVSHLKAIGTRNWRKAVPDMLQKIETARAQGLDVHCDVYPYPAGSTQLIHVLPPEIQKGGTAAMTAALRDPAVRKRLIERMETGRDFENIIHLTGFDHVIATSMKKNPQLEGKTLAEIAALWQKNPYDALFDLLESEQCEVSMIDFIVAEQDICEILQAEYSGVISDATYPTEGLCHPRVYGTFPRLLQRYVKEQQVLSLEAAVHKITGQPAELFGLQGKGKIEVGADADLCLFDLDQIAEKGTWQKPAVFAEGMDWVFVNGIPQIADGAFCLPPAGTCLIGCSASASRTF